MAKRQAGAPRRPGYAKRLIIMAKSPVAGRVKRRLRREIGDVAATSFYRNSLTHIVLRLAFDRRWRTILAVDGGDSLAMPLRKKLASLPQGKGDLGRRMHRLFTRLPPGPAIIVGSDIPAIRPAHIAEAFKLLAGADAVLGPAQDGGYWLIGLSRTPKILAPFAGVRWSGPHALADTLANLEGKRIALAATLRDVDEEQDLGLETGRAARLVVAPSPQRGSVPD
jgi:rSAM/selenodomain-associated transferase 1